jgi:hypothetical protein
VKEKDAKFAELGNDNKELKKKTDGLEKQLQEALKQSTTNKSYLEKREEELKEKTVEIAKLEKDNNTLKAKFDEQERQLNILSIARTGFIVDVWHNDPYVDANEAKMARVNKVDLLNSSGSQPIARLWKIVDFAREHKLFEEVDQPGKDVEPRTDSTATNLRKELEDLRAKSKNVNGRYFRFIQQLWGRPPSNEFKPKEQLTLARLKQAVDCAIKQGVFGDLDAWKEDVAPQTDPTKIPPPASVSNNRQSSAETTQPLPPVTTEKV